MIVFNTARSTIGRLVMRSRCKSHPPTRYNSKKNTIPHISAFHSFTTSANSVWENMDEKTRSLAKLLLREASTTDTNQIAQQRSGLSRAITLIESRKDSHQQQSNLLLTYLLNQRENYKQKSKSFRLGIAGPPGAGKSTFVECFGKFLLQLEETTPEETPEDPFSMCRKLAVVCIDPSSAVTGGSILGDKTRMMDISNHGRAFVRPSPTKTVLGGLAAYTDDVVSLCQVAGYDFIIIETVGLGQSEIEVKESVDLLMLMVPPGGGDDLQGIKKGIVEVSDMICVTKADGKFLQAAKRTAVDYSGALRMMPRTGLVNLPGWETPPVVLVSSQDGTGIEHIWSKICQFRRLMIETGEFERKREQQAHYWMWKNVHNLILAQTQNNPHLKKKAEQLERLLVQGKTTPRVAATELVESLVKIGP